MKLTQLFEFFGNKLTIEPSTQPPMSPTLIALIISLVEEFVKIAPQAYQDLQTIFSKPNPTPEDWEALRAKVLSISYADYVPASDLPPDSPAAEIPPLAIAQAESNGPISQPGATAAPEIQAQEQKQPDPAPEPPVAAAPEPPSLPDGTRNPLFNHLA